MDDVTPLQADAESENEAERSVALGVEGIVDLLRHGTMETQRELPWSSNYTFVVHISRDDVTAAAVYKPKRGESPLWDFPTGTLYRREEAAFVVSEALGWQLVPPTVARKGEYGIGMVQFFIQHDPEEHFFTFRDPWEEQLTRMVLFDVIINNADRKAGHMLRDEGGKIWAIDHGVTFHEEYKLRTVAWELAGQPIDEQYLVDLAKFQQELQAGCPLSERLERLLSPTEVDALRRRVARLLLQKEFPMPRPGRPHVPWPLV